MDLESVVKKIREMRIRGALDIAIASASAMNSVVEKSAKTTPELISNLRKAGKKLKSARPSAVSLPNSVNYILYLADKKRDLRVDEFRRELSSEISDFIKEQKNALNKISEIGSRLIDSGDVILTHCNSDTVNGILKRVWKKRKKIHVICTETRPMYQGHITARELSSYGIPVTMIIDSAVHHIMKELKVDKVMVGADTVCVNGDLINKIGTSQIAVCAKEQDIEFIVAAESIKFSPLSITGKIVEIEKRDPKEIIDPKKLKGVKILNPVFDITNSEYIDMIVTEFGVIPPQASYNLLKEKFGWGVQA